MCFRKSCILTDHYHPRCRCTQSMVILAIVWCPDEDVNALLWMLMSSPGLSELIVCQKEVIQTFLYTSAKVSALHFFRLMIDQYSGGHHTRVRDYEGSRNTSNCLTKANISSSKVFKKIKKLNKSTLEYAGPPWLMHLNRVLHGIVPLMIMI